MSISRDKEHKCKFCERETGDKGQRFEVTYEVKETGERKVFGWAESHGGAASMVESIKKSGKPDSNGIP